MFIFFFFFYLFRSSLSWKHHIDVGAGVVDRDYRGNVGVVLFNLSKSDYEVHHGDRIAQLIVERISTPPLVEVEVRNNLRFILKFNFLKINNNITTSIFLFCQD